MSSVDGVQEERMEHDNFAGDARGVFFQQPL